MALTANEASAHARWFVDDTQIPLRPDFPWDNLAQAMLVAPILAVIAALIFEFLSCRSPFLHRLTARRVPVPTMLLWRFLAVAFGATLVICGMTHVFVAPNLPAQFRE